LERLIGPTLIAAVIGTGMAVEETEFPVPHRCSLNWRRQGAEPDRWLVGRAMLRCVLGSAHFLGACPSYWHKNGGFSVHFHKFGRGVAEKTRFCAAAELFSSGAFISLALTS
jgi:hypothetical protein